VRWLPLVQVWEVEEPPLLYVVVTQLLASKVVNMEAEEATSLEVVTR
jgi:hypothetical protein